MREEIKTCSDSSLCDVELRALDNTIISILHIPGKHIIHTLDDYDNNGNLNEEICDELANIGIFHANGKMNEDNVKELKDKVEFIKKGLKV